MTEAMTQMMDSLAAPNMEKVKEEEKMEEKPTYPYDWWDRRNDRWWPQYKLLDGRWVGINVNSVPGCTPPSSSSLSSSTSTSSSYVPGTAASYKPSSSTAASSESSIKPGEVEDYKIIVTGGRGVGKAALCVQFIQNVFLTGYDPERDDSYNKLLSIDGKNCMVHLLDLVGEEEHSVMRGVYLNNAQGFVIMYSITDKSSFDSLNTCRERILHSKGVASIPCVLVGNKVDLESERQVTAAEATALAASWNVPFFETSARIRVHVDESFYEMVREIRRANAPPPSKCNVM
ncbi:small GTPase superfamily [Pelomyxa schiedti]|nr:small GTPase superfamily [Pelomyxa schiedti]